MDKDKPVVLEITTANDITYLAASLAVEDIISQAESTDLDIRRQDALGFAPTLLEYVITGAASAVALMVRSVIHEYFQRNAQKRLVVRVGEDEFCLSGYSKDEVDGIVSAMLALRRSSNAAVEADQAPLSVGEGKEKKAVGDASELSSRDRPNSAGLAI